MAMRVAEIREWLATLDDDDLVGIHEDEMALTLADERYDEASLEIGMALSSAFLEAELNECRDCGGALDPETKYHLIAGTATMTYQCVA